MLMVHQRALFGGGPSIYDGIGWVFYSYICSWIATASPAFECLRGSRPGK